MRHSMGTVITRPELCFDGVKVFSATMANDRQQLGDKVTSWIAEHRHVQLTELTVTQSSDSSFHCITIAVFYRESH